MRHRLAGDRSDPLQRLLVDERMGLADHDRLAAELAIALGERPGAPHQAAAALDDDVGIGADHRHVARPPGNEAVLVVVGALGVVVEQAGAGDHLAVGLVAEDMRHALVDRPVAIRPEMVDARADLAGEEVAGDIAGRQDVVIGIARHAHALEHRQHAALAAGRVGEEQHDAAGGAIAHQGIDGGGMGGDAVVHHAPDVAEQRPVGGSKLGEAGYEGGRRSVGHAHRLWACRVTVKRER